MNIYNIHTYHRINRLFENMFLITIIIMSVNIITDTFYRFKLRFHLAYFMKLNVIVMYEY